MEESTLTEKVAYTILEFDGKEFKFEAFLPTLAGSFFSSNYQQFSKLMTGNDQGTSLEEFMKIQETLVELIVFVNKKKYPDLTAEFIRDNFDLLDYQAVLGIYYSAWFKIVNPKIATELTPPKDSGGK